MLAFSNDYYGFIFRVTQSVELFCTYYRDELKIDKDTFLCLKINDYFEIYEWRTPKFVMVDKVSEYLSGNYRDLKTYSVY